MANLRKAQQPGLIAIVKVGGAVGNFVGEVDQLRFQGRAFVEEVFSQFGVFGFCLLYTSDAADE